MTQLPNNKKYFIDFFEEHFSDRRFDARVLDYGCGYGDIIEYATEKKYNFFGVDNYYDNKNPDYVHEKLNENIKDRIRTINENGKIPFENEYFDLIYSNQVFEHVKDLETTLMEMYRILKPNGIMVHNFPVMEYILEGHIGIPFVHWFKNCKIQLFITRFFLVFGMGYNKKNPFIRNEWLKSSLYYVNNYCSYRSWEKITINFSQYFDVTRIDKEKTLYHLSYIKGKAKILKTIVGIIPRQLIGQIEKRRGSITLLCKKKRINLNLIGVTCEHYLGKY